MPIASPEISLCPLEFIAEAIALVLCDIAPSQRREIAGTILDAAESGLQPDESLYVALRNKRLWGAAWGQRQPGNTAVLWPPQLIAGEDEQSARRLAEAVIEALDAAGVEMTQVLLPSSEAVVAPTLKAVGFRHLAELLYLTCEADRFATSPPKPCDLEYVSYDDSQLAGLMNLVERTYEGTLDCADLNGVRRIEHVIAGYQSTGVFRPENWLIVRSGDRDVGVLLLADHPAARHWELMYMGLVPEARGRCWGRQITRHAQWLAHRAEIERIVLAVDAANHPALQMYGAAGFDVWDRRCVFVRTIAKPPT